MLKGFPGDFMKLLFPILAAAAVGINFVQSGGKAALATHDKTLKSAKSLNVAFTLQPLSGAAETGSLVFSRPNLFRIEFAGKLFLSDGASLIELDRKSNTYTVVPLEGQLEKIVATTPWGAFFINEPFKTAKAVDAGTKRMIKGNQVLDIALTQESGKAAHIYFDPKLGFARGWSTDVLGTEWITLATEVKVGTEPLPASEFAFDPPEGAKKTEGPPKAEGVSYSAVNAIFMGNCMPCHNSTNRKGGFEANSYAAVMRGSKSGAMVVPGDSKNSALVKYLTGDRQPRMPWNKPMMPQKTIDVVRAWIDAGAKQ